jgi:superfamily II DNA or RNA helicase
MTMRRFTRKQRTELWLASHGICAICGEPLPEFHADHIKPWSRGGSTINSNGQAICRRCNQKKGVSMLRQHQQEFLETCRLIKSREGLRKVVASIVPGGGKSALPVIAASELIPYVGDRIAWITPRENLRIQAESAFTAGWLRSLLGHSNEVREAVNEADPLRDKIGYATTYQALVAARSYSLNPHINVFNQHRMVLFLDELQHAYVDGEFDLALRPLVERATVVVIMSGGLSRNDQKRIANLDYLERDAKGRCYVDLNSNPKQAVIMYGLADATREHAIIKINFELCDCEAEWDIADEDDRIVDEGSIATFDGATVKDTSKGINVALRTEFFETLLEQAAVFWKDRRKHNPRSLFLVVAPYISEAQRALKILNKIGISAAIATSDDPKNAQDAIERFRKGEVICLVTVAMAYEGMDAPQADVLACLTHVRSREWIEQMIHRVTRWDVKNPLRWEHQFATVFAPKDRFFREIMAEMKAEQAPYVKEAMSPPPPPPPPPNGSKLRARQSAMTDRTAETFNDPPVEGDEHRQLTDAMMAAEIHGAIPISAAQKFFAAMMSPDSATQPEAEDVLEPRKREKKLRDQIVGLQREGYYKDLPAEIKKKISERIERRGKAMWKMFHKSLDELTEAELKAVWDRRAFWAVS